MRWEDSARGTPFAKDPCVLQTGRREYLLYYTMQNGGGYAMGIARSRDLTTWEKAGEILPSAPYEAKGLCAPMVLSHGGKVHLFYQSYGGGREDAICHAVSGDGLRFERDESNPVFRPTGGWNCGRAIDAEVVIEKESALLLAATRDPAYKVQMIVAARAPLAAGFGRGAWKMAADRPVLRPELPWEKQCIEAPSVIVRDGRMWCFYAGAYNNEPQQIGCAWSTNGVDWTRVSSQPLLANGAPGSWNESESGHPCVFRDADGSTHLFFQGNSDKGKTWYLSRVELDWTKDGPRVRGQGVA
jgi:predicted GH43/DUF377 family glycosyl hydrolase